jgi:DNA gyrase subunit A
VSQDTTLPPEGGRIEPVDLQGEMQRSYLDYAMSVIVGRALPDVRDGLKPVHRRVLYAMYDGGYRPDRGYNKCARIVGDVMGQYHPHGDSAIYDALVRLAQPWSLRYPLIDSQGNFGSPGNDPPAAMRYTECRMAQLAMEMVRDIDKDTVDFTPNYDGKTNEPLILPSRFPNLLVNGSAGIAVGMATNIPPHNLREVAEGAQWALDHPGATREELLEALMERIKGPDFPTGAYIVGRRGIEEAYRTGRGSIMMRAVIDVEEDNRGRQLLVITQLPYQVNPDNLALRIAELVNDGKLAGIADIRDDSSSRTGQRLVIVLKRDAVAKVVIANLYKQTQLQDTFGCNMVALVDNVPRTLSLDGFIRHWVAHQIEVVVRRTRYLLAEAERLAHVARGLVKALDQLDAVIALIRGSASAEAARSGLMELLDVDEVQATAILDMQLRKLAALERQKLIDDLARLESEIADYNDILASEPRQRTIVSEELAGIVEKHGDERRSVIVPFDGEVSMEDLIAEEPVVVTITNGGYAKRTKTDLYRAQRRGGKGIIGAQLRQDDVVEHFFVTTTHHWLLFFTDKGRVYRAKAYELPEAARSARGQHVANLLAFQPDENIAQVLALKDYQVAPYLVLATNDGLVKKTALQDFDSNRTGGVIAINLREGDAVISARLVSADDDLLLVSHKGQSIRFKADDEALRPMGRATSGVIGMRFKSGDELLAMMVVRPDAFVFTATDGGYAKRTAIDEYPLQGRGGQGVLTAKLTDDRGGLVGALMVDETDEVFAITSGGGVIRTRADEVRPTSRATMGVRLINLGDGDAVVGVTRNAESASGVDEIDDALDDVLDDAEAAGLMDADLAEGSSDISAMHPADDDASGDNGRDERGSVAGAQDDSGGAPHPVTGSADDDSAADPEQGDS